MRVLVFLRLVDETGYLSLTNIAVILVLVKLMLVQAVNFSEMATLLTVISAYSFKRYTRKHDAKPIQLQDGIMKDLAELRSDVNKLKLATGMTRHVDARSS
jgi:hypothetical protein